MDVDNTDKSLINYGYQLSRDFADNNFFLNELLLECYDFKDSYYIYLVLDSLLERFKEFYNV